MKQKRSLSLILAMISGLAHAQESNLGFDCQLRSAWAESSDACLVKGESNPSVAVIGLHYGSLHTSQINIEVLKAAVSQEKLRDLASRLELAISQTNEDPNGSQNMHILESRVAENGTLEFPLPYDISHLFISRLELRVKDRKDTLQNTVQEIFGTRAVGILTGTRRVRN